MSHMVIYRGVDGKPGYQQADDIHDAVAFVEEKRNDEGVEQARIFRLEEVVFEYKPYYRVELAGANAAAVDTTASVEVDVVEPKVEPDLASAPAPDITGDIDPAVVASISRDDIYPVDDVEQAGMVINVDQDAETIGTGSSRGLFGR